MPAGRRLASATKCRGQLSSSGARNGKSRNAKRPDCLISIAVSFTLKSSSTASELDRKGTEARGLRLCGTWRPCAHLAPFKGTKFRGNDARQRTTPGNQERKSHEPLIARSNYSSEQQNHSGLVDVDINLMLGWTTPKHTREVKHGQYDDHQ